MPETIDSAGNPEINELPALHTPTPSGIKPKTPTDPNALTGPSPIGMGKAPSPMGAPGAPPGGGKPPVPVPEAPMEALNNRSIDALGQDIKQLIKKYDIKDKEELKDKILEEWRVDRINELIDYTDSLSSEELFGKAVDKDYKPEVEEQEGMPDLQSPPVGDTTGPPKLTKPDNDQTGLNPKQPTAILNKTRGVLMKQAILKDGTIVVKEASTDVSDVIAGITNARRKVEATLKDYINAKLIKAGMDSLGMDLPMKDDIGSILGGPEKAEDGLSAVISKLKDVVEELIVALEKGDAVKSDSSIDIPPKDMKDLEGEMDKGKDTIKDVKDKGPLSDMKKEEKEDEKESSEEEGAMKEAGKDSQKAMDVAMGKTGPGKKKEKGKKCAEEEESTTEVTADVTETPEIAETAPAEGEQTTETSEVTAEETEGKEVTAEEAEVSIEVEAENDEEEEDGKEKEASESESIVNKIMTRVSEMKKANLYPFKDLNKQQVDNTNATTAKDQASTINKEIKGGKQPSKADSGKAPSISPTDIKTDLKAQKGKISVEAAERIKQHSVDNAVSKARLSVELAARQQLKGLIDNPLKQACVKNMVEAGIPEATADAIVHNAFIDGYEEMQKQIIKEAFDTFMEKDIKDFIKVAEFTDSYTVKESSESPEEGEGTQVKTASASAPLRGTQVRDDRKGEYKRFWETVAYERKGGEI